MAEALISAVLEQSVTVSFDHTKEAVKLILNAKKEVEKFSSNLEAIQAVLEDAEKQQVEKDSVRNWLDKLNDVSYEMVDVLDKWNTEILKQEVKKKTSKKKIMQSHAHPSKLQWLVSSRHDDYPFISRPESRKELNWCCQAD